MSSQTEDSPLSEFKNATGQLLFINVIFYVFAFIVGLLASANGYEQTLSLYQMPQFSVIVFGFSLLTFPAFFWTIITSLFLHADLGHLFGNMLFLLIFGFFMEDKGFKNKDIYKAYFISGFGSLILSAPILGNSFQVGASGAIFGLLGVIVGWARKRQLEEKNRMLAAGIIFFIFSSTNSNTNIFAHFLGFVIGIVLGAYGFVGRELKTIE
ncbi:MAG: rhomboid family intramembrane serine protease [Methanobacteriota archaeon]|nr:MAG: rhomboid family intramembrane serine protease [Euryarchaeota archaeon]